MADAPQANPDSDASLSLAQALVESFATPLVLLGADLGVIWASRSFCEAFGLAQDTLEGRSFFQLGVGEWVNEPLKRRLSATASGEAGFSDFDLVLNRTGQPPQQLVLNGTRLTPGTPDGVYVILSLDDVTDVRTSARLKDAALQETILLLQEVRHRVANSLQIVAGVLTRSAHQVKSDEARAHLQGAYHRIMAVATLERQLSMADRGEVAVGPYMADLCTCLAAAILPDAGQIDFEVEADDSVVDAAIAVSLGLMVNELLINAIKHAFPAGRAGKVTVSYRSQGEGWTLSVKDNGVGRASATPSETPGQGTSIIHALAKQYQATVRISDAYPGSETSIVREPREA